MTDALLPEDPRDALIREQAERLAVQDRQIAEFAVQGEQIAALEAMVADLRERLETALRSLSRNSGNSSMAERVQHDLHEVRCPCGRAHAAP